MARHCSGELIMKIRTVARLVAIGIALALAGFVGAIGVLTLIFSPKAGAYAPATSSDAAAWIQAVGSIAAIAAAYWLGERQARKAREQAIEVHNLLTTRVENGVRAVIQQLYKELLFLAGIAKKNNYADFVKEWNLYNRATLAGALAAFDRLPIHELGNRERIHYAFELKGVAELAFNRISHLLGPAPAFDHTRHTPSTEHTGPVECNDDHQIAEIRLAATVALEALTEFRKAFDNA